MLEFIGRETRVLETLSAFVQGRLRFVTVGGYAVSAYRHRFSIDADVVIPEGEERAFAEVLKSLGFERTVLKTLGRVYASEFVRYEHKEWKVSVDLLIGGIAARQTGASFPFSLLAEHAQEREIVGTEKSARAPVCSRELLAVLKLHSGRLTDFRDIAALSGGLDLALVRKHLFRGDTAVLAKHQQQLAELVEQQSFIDSFKGVFQEQRYRIDREQLLEIAKLKPPKD